MASNSLESLFRPQSVAVIGAANDPENPGLRVMKNIMGGGFMGPVMPVSGAKAIAGVLTYPDVESLPMAPDLAVLCGPLKDAPDILARLGAKGGRAAVCVSPGFGTMSSEAQVEFSARLLAAARKAGIRLVGPKCLGIVVPGIGLNASLAHASVQPGKIAFITQSDSLFTAVLDWAGSKGIGFSHLISLGARLDVSFSDVLDYLGSDPNARSILLYIENIMNARYFLSAARAAARNKPILVIRPGQALDSLSCVAQPEGAPSKAPYLAGADIYDVAFSRAGMLRVHRIDSLFDAAQTLNRLQPVFGNRLAILTNGGSAGVLAADALLAGGGKLACPSDPTRGALLTLLGETWNGTGPVDLPYNAPGGLYAEAIRLLTKDPDVDALLVLHVPFAGLPEVDTAQAIAQAMKKAKIMALTAWLGAGSGERPRQVFQDAGLPAYDTPEAAIMAFFYMVDYQKGQELLMQTPDSLPTDFFPDTTQARELVAQALAEGRSELLEPEARKVLAAYGVPMVETRVTRSSKEAVIAAEAMGYPVALKLRSPQIRQPYEVGGIALDLESGEKVWDAAAGILARVSRQRPDAYIDGFTVQKMGRRPGAHELFISAFVDPVFGPAIAFGHGGMAREMIKDQSLTLPPLNMSLARELISRTRISKLLRGTPSQPQVDMDDVCLTLIQISQLIIDVPEIVGLDINPLFADDHGVLALNAKILVAPATGTGPDRLAIRPYPRELEECVVLKNGRKVTLRPIRPEDEPAHRVFIARLTDDDLRLRFFGVVRREFDHKDMARFTQIDYDREMAFIATGETEGGGTETLGVIRTSTNPDNSEAEFAIVVRSDLKGMSLGKVLFEKMIRYTRERGTTRIKGQTMPENAAMAGLARHLGFAVSRNREEETIDMILELNP